MGHDGYTVRAVGVLRKNVYYDYAVYARVGPSILKCDICVLRCTVTGKLSVCFPRVSLVWKWKCLSFSRHSHWRRNIYVFLMTLSTERQSLLNYRDIFTRDALRTYFLGNR
jgi:hypothetical protein